MYRHLYTQAVGHMLTPPCPLRLPPPAPPLERAPLSPPQRADASAGADASAAPRLPPRLPRPPHASSAARASVPPQLPPRAPPASPPCCRRRRRFRLRLHLRRRTNGRPPWPATEARPRVGLARLRISKRAAAAVPMGTRATRACSACARGRSTRCHSPWGGVLRGPMAPWVTAHPKDGALDDAGADYAVNLEAAQPPATRAMQVVALRCRLGWSSRGA